MFFKYLLKFLILAPACAYLSAAAFAADADPLFADNSTLEVRLIAPMATLMRDRPFKEDEELAGTFELIATDGTVQQFPVNVRTRGNFRRRPDICPYAPLRLNFKKSEMKGTLLAKQDKLKMVTHCKSNSNIYEQTVIKEYLVYRIMNQLSDLSFRVRLLRITYVDSDNGDEESSFAILIESKERLAKRIGMEQSTLQAINQIRVDPAHMNLTAMFEYLVGNLDFSPVSGSPGEPCCHNFALFSADKKTYWSIPYDFDLTGLVEAPHHEPNPKYAQRDIRHRIYRGRCINNDILPATLQTMRDKREDIEGVVAAQVELSKGARNRVESFINDFYKPLGKEDKLIKKLEKACIG
jgi:hypothetical protein